VNITIVATLKTRPFTFESSTFTFSFEAHCRYSGPNILFLSQSDFFCQLTAGAEGSCCIWSHSMTQKHTHTLTHTHSWLLWTGDRPVAKTSTWQHTPLEPTVSASERPQTHSLSKRAATDPQSQQASGHRPTVPASERPQTHALDGAATGIG